MVKYGAFCEHVAVNLSETYSELYKHSTLAEASVVFNEFEDFDLKDVKLHFIPPRRPISLNGKLSSGEYAMAAIALLYTQLTYSKAPFVVLANVDNILNNENTKLLMDFLNEKSLEMQIIIFSSKPMISCYASKVLGIIENTNGSSSETRLIIPDNYLANF